MSLELANPEPRRTGQPPSELPKPRCYKIREIPHKIRKEEYLEQLTTVLLAPDAPKKDDLRLTLARSSPKFSVATLMLSRPPTGLEVAPDMNGITPLYGEDDAVVEWVVCRLIQVALLT